MSVVMNCLNGDAYVLDAIASVRAQTYPDWELVFWDNASTDRTPALVASVDDERIRYFRGQETVTLGAARNLAVAQTRGRYIAFLDADDLWMPTKLSTQVALMDESPRAGFAFSDTIFFDETGDIRQLYGTSPQPEGDVFEHLLRAYTISLETVIIRKAAIDGLAFVFDPTLSLTEEKDLLLRIATQWQAAYSPSVLAKWRIHGASETHQRYLGFAEENERIIGRLSAMIPDLEGRYARALVALRAKIARQRAVGHMLRGERKAARRVIGGRKWSQLSWMAMAVATFLPRGMIQLIYRLAWRRS